MRATTHALGALLFTIAFSTLAVGQDIVWVADLENAKQIAAEQDRLVLVHFYGDSCPPCKLLEQNVFPRADVQGALNAKYVAVKISGNRMRGVAKQFRVNRWPTDVIMSADGKILSHRVSPQDPREYIAMLQRAVVSAQAASVAATNQAVQRPAAAVGPVTRQVGYTPNAEPSGGSFQGGGQFTGGGQFAGGQPYTQPAVQPRTQTGGQFGQGAVQGNPATQGTQYPAGQTPYQTQPSARQTSPTQPQGAQPGQAPSEERRYQYDPRGAAGAEKQKQQWPPNYTQPSQQQPLTQNQPGNQFVPGQATQTQAPPTQQQITNPAATAPRVASNAWPQQQTAASKPISGGPRGQDSPLCLDGYCAVTLVTTQKWTKADPRWGAIHRRRTYQFATEEAQKLFLSDPDRFAPVLSGYDPVVLIEHRHLEPGFRKHGVFYQEHIYLFSSEETLQRFWQAPEQYANATRAAMQANELGPLLR